MKKYIFSLAFICGFLQSNAQKTEALEVYVTSDSTQQKMQKIAVSSKFHPYIQEGEFDNYVLINPKITYQKFLGIGGAITDASAEVFYALSKEKQNEILKAYYSKEGLRYNLGRTSIHSCDFSSASYTYTKENDKNLSTFSIDMDKKYRIPLLKEILKETKGNFTLYASPWSPPAWMKTNNDMLHGGKLKKEDYQIWANYFVKFIQAYQKEGVPIWGMTVQNEPMATQIWESCQFSAKEEGDFVKNFLYPTLKKNNLVDKKIIIWDHNRNMMVQRATETLDAETQKMVWGVGFHWYEDWILGKNMYENVKKVHELFPNQNLLFTEGCNAPFDASKLYSWALGEKYGSAMINDFNAGTVGWTDWNILLDEKGGPNHVKNYCFAPIHANAKTNEVIYTSAYYYIGHFSKFIEKNAKRIEISTNNSNLQCTSFVNPDGKIVIVIMNQTDKSLKYKLLLGQKEIDLRCAKHSIYTIIL